MYHGIPEAAQPIPMAPGTAFTVFSEGCHKGSIPKLKREVVTGIYISAVTRRSGDNLWNGQASYLIIVDEFTHQLVVLR